MALATRCPSCHALFRVVADQLKLRGGLVRCGSCGHVFDAIGTLSYLDDASIRPAASPPTGGPEPAPAAPAQFAEPVAEPVAVAEPPIDAAPAPSRAEEPVAEAAASVETDATPPLETRPEETIDHKAAAAPIEAETPAATPSPASDDVESRPGAAELPHDAGAAAETAEEPAAPDADAPAFLQETDAPRRRAATLAYALGAALAALALALQLVLMYRAEIAAQLPATRPALAAACQAMRCTVGWPMQGELLAIVGSELQSLPGTSALELTAVVRNRAAITLALPALEVTLTDTQNRAVARRIFGPSDYLAPSEAAARLADGLQAGADMTVRITFEARGSSVAGFVVYPFYL